MSSVWNERKWARLLCTTILLALVGYGGFLRFHDLDVSLYDDEINTRERAMQSVTYTLKTRNYPLYYLSAKAALQFGDTEIALRLPSFIAGLLAIFAIFGLVRQLHSRTAGLVAAALLTFNPFHITHSNFARYYALLLLFTILTVWMLHLALERGRWHQWLGYTAAAFLALASHICFAPALGMLNVGAAIYILARRDRGTLKRRVLQVAFLGACTLVACSFLLYKDVGPSRFFKDYLPFGNTPVSAATEIDPTGAAKADTPAEAGPASIGELAPEVWSGPSIVDAHRQHPRGGGAEFTNPETGKTEVLLTYYDCLEYLKRYFWTDTAWVWPALVVVGILGILDLLYRVPSAGLPLFFAFFFSPVPFFFLATDHWYHPRYFSYLFIIALVSIAVGLCVLPRFLSRVLTAPKSLHLWRRLPETPVTRSTRTANIVYLVLVGALAIPALPIINESYQTYPVTGYLPQGPLVVNRTPERDWRSLYEFVSHNVQEGDQFLFMSPKGEHGLRYARYYFAKFLPWAENETHFQHQFGVPTAAYLHEIAAQNPTANIWMIGYLKYDANAYARLLSTAGAQQVNFHGQNKANGLVLFYIGAPTTNHIKNGNFETRAPRTLPEIGTRDGDVSFNGIGSLQITYPASEVGDQRSWQRYTSLPITPASYRLRNNGFDAWDPDGHPVGWRIRSADPSPVSKADPGFMESVSLQIAPSDEDTVLAQSISMGLAPGRRVEMKMMALSHTPNNLHLVLRYQGPGYQREEHTVHPGDASWVRMTMAVDIPKDADPKSITVELWRMAGGEGTAIIDDVEMRVADIGGRLEPHQPYVLSLALRTEALRNKGGSDQLPAGYVRLRWEDEDGENQVHRLIEVHQEEGWHQHAVTFTPGIDIPPDMNALFLEVGLENGTGTIWVDQVQLEKGLRPSPYTDSFRLPLDETLSQVDLKSLEVDASWD